MSAIRRRSSQYSLFPNCSPTPEKDSAPNANIGNLRKRHSESSVRSLVAHIPPQAPVGVNNVPTNNHEPKQSSIMARLIPLKLEATTSDTKTSSPSDKPLPLLPTTKPTQRSPAPVEYKPSKKARPGPVTDLTILPYTQKEWSTVMEEVRVLYSKGQYKHCAMRCKQILEGIKDPVSQNSTPPPLKNIDKNTVPSTPPLLNLHVLLRRQLPRNDRQHAS